MERPWKEWSFTEVLLRLYQQEPQASQAQNTWCMRQVVYIENHMGKSLIVKKLFK